jgi:hypothetical protein
MTLNIKQIFSNFVKRAYTFKCILAYQSIILNIILVKILFKGKFFNKKSQKINFQQQ